MATFPKAIYANKSEKAPDYIICNIKILRHDFKQWLDEQLDDTVKLVVKKSKEGKVYVQVDEYVAPAKNETKPETNDEPPY